MIKSTTWNKSIHILVSFICKKILKFISYSGNSSCKAILIHILQRKEFNLLIINLELLINESNSVLTLISFPSLRIQSKEDGTSGIIPTVLVFFIGCFCFILVLLVLVWTNHTGTVLILYHSNWKPVYGLEPAFKTFFLSAMFFLCFHEIK